MGLEVDVQGWAYWPGQEDLSIEFTRLLGAAQEGGATVAECFATASRIGFSDDQSWYTEWKKTADASCRRADDALRNGRVLTARSNWLRAISYYQAAASPLDLADQNRQAAIEANPASERKSTSSRWLAMRASVGSLCLRWTFLAQGPIRNSRRLPAAPIWK